MIVKEERSQLLNDLIARDQSKKALFSFLATASLTSGVLRLLCVPPALAHLRVPALLPPYEQGFKGSTQQFWRAWSAASL